MAAHSSEALGAMTLCQTIRRYPVARPRSHDRPLSVCGGLPPRIGGKKKCAGTDIPAPCLGEGGLAEAGRGTMAKKRIVYQLSGTCVCISNYDNLLLSGKTVDCVISNDIP